MITRTASYGRELLLFRHPTAGIQLPAGTVEEGETSEQAVLREVAEETGLHNVRLAQWIGQRDEMPSYATHVILHTTRVYSRPLLTSFDWAALRRGFYVRMLRQMDGFAQVTFEENNRFPDPEYISYQITGWVPEATLARTNRRSFYHLELVGDTPDTWDQISDYHTFQLFWARLDHLPEIVPPQQEWVDFVRSELGYRF